ncbi:ATP-binding protein [Polyangium spumosum]|uniref:Transcriptional regulator n=1 Tax=Polyangium spumosum TaxID=889282 RepID=A0A6N7PES7_9BACT|nr:ATP-binding protein [Polyangium spumosum]MRG90563.1 transcriptional regulator [Polyangium spumosum]
MEREELEEMLRDVESDRVERTRSAKDAEKIGQAICAFANDLPNSRKPGYLFMGANDDGSASGLVIKDQLLQSLAAFRSDGDIQPIPSINVQKWSLAGGEMAVVEVLPSDLPPVRYKGLVWIRIGPRKGVASEQDERVLSERRALLARTWDARPCRGSSLADLSLDLFSLTYRTYAVAPEVIEENHRSIEQQLAALRFLDTRESCPTNAGVLLFAKDPLFFVPGAYVQYVHYDGPTQAEDVLRERRFSGDLLSVLRGLDDLAASIEGARPVALPQGGDRTICDYPRRAMHELLVNAVIHRNYDGSSTPVSVNHFSDRIEILSPGGLYPDLTPDQFPGGTSYRNPVLAESAKVLGFVNRFGRGIAIVQAELARNGSPPAVFEPGYNRFLVTVPRRT